MGRKWISLDKIRHGRCERKILDTIKLNLESYRLGRAAEKESRTDHRNKPDKQKAGRAAEWELWKTPKQIKGWSNPKFGSNKQQQQRQ